MVEVDPNELLREARWLNEMITFVEEMGAFAEKVRDRAPASSRRHQEAVRLVRDARNCVLGLQGRLEREHQLIDRLTGLVPAEAGS
jgi:hypothetical protein